MSQVCLVQLTEYNRQKSSLKKSSLTFFFQKKIPKMHLNKRCYYHGKKGLDNKNTRDYIQYADAQKKSPFYENVSDKKTRTFVLFFFFFGYIFLRTLIPGILYISWGLIDNPYIILGQKIPRNLILEGFFSSNILSNRTSENKDIFTKVFLPNFFSCDCLSQIHATRAVVEELITLPAII